MRDKYQDFRFWRGVLRDGAARYDMIVYSRAWSPDVPICEWIIPGTWREMQ